jgi:hypothetical protein
VKVTLPLRFSGEVEVAGSSSQLVMSLVLVVDLFYLPSVFMTMFELQIKSFLYSGC